MSQTDTCLTGLEKEGGRNDMVGQPGFELAMPGSEGQHSITELKNMQSSYMSIVLKKRSDKDAR